MHSLQITRQLIFVNDSINNTVRANKVDKDVESATAFEQNPSKKVLEGDVIKRGEPDNFAQADDIFKRAEYFKSLSSSVKQGIQAYTSIDNEFKREQIKLMMGVDLYA